MPTWRLIDVSDQQLAELEAEFTAAALAQHHPKIAQWRHDTIQLGKGIRDSVNLLVDQSRADSFAATMKTLGLPTNLFKAQLLEIAGTRLVACINFRNAKGDFPYVRVLRSTSPLGCLTDVQTLRAAFSDTFAPFKPEAVSFFHPSQLPLQIANAEPDEHILMAKARDMAALAVSPKHNRVALRKAVSTEFYPNYKETYELMFVDRPMLRDIIHIEAEEDLQDSVAKNLLFEIFVDGEWSGVVAANREASHGIDCIYMIDIVLTADKRGRQLGPVVHHHFASAVSTDEPDVIIFGTIAAVNPWSRQTALRAGRIDVGAWHLLSLKR
jgi:hypothetical protein